jgi:hypothetical protein
MKIQLQSSVRKGVGSDSQKFGQSITAAPDKVRTTLRDELFGICKVGRYEEVVDQICLAPTVLFTKD